jgi:hypothetical protein
MCWALCDVCVCIGSLFCLFSPLFRVEEKRIPVEIESRKTSWIVETNFKKKQNKNAEVDSFQVKQIIL